jgi:ABC-type molybdate transport system substrate-binding protein
MDYLEKAKLIRAGTRRNLLGNQLILVEPSSDADSKLKIAQGFDLVGAAGDGKIAVCAIDSCPGGIYAKEALEKLGVFESVESKLAQADNIQHKTAGFSTRHEWLSVQPHRLLTMGSTIQSGGSLMSVMPSIIVLAITALVVFHRELTN